MGREADRYDSFNIAIVLSVSGMLPGSPSGQQVLLEPECITRASSCASAATPYLARLLERKHQSRIMQISELSLLLSRSALFRVGRAQFGFQIFASQWFTTSLTDGTNAGTVATGEMRIAHRDVLVR